MSFFTHKVRESKSLSTLPHKAYSNPRTMCKALLFHAGLLFWFFFDCRCVYKEEHKQDQRLKNSFAVTDRKCALWFEEARSSPQQHTHKSFPRSTEEVVAGRDRTKHVHPDGHLEFSDAHNLVGCVSSPHKPDPLCKFMKNYSIPGNRRSPPFTIFTKNFLG